MKLRSLFALVSSLPLVSLACGSVVSVPGSGPCEVGGVTYASGQAVPSTGCQSCVCTDGAVVCDGGACPVTCEWQGAVYPAGSSFPAGDGCNTCSCDADGQVGCTLVWCGDTCEWQGQTYGEGQSFPAGDGCNTCTCEAGGQVACTLQVCPEGCTYLGFEHAAGETFPDADGCNTCSCAEAGLVSCTELACSCDPPSEWWRSYVASSPEQCAVIDYDCAPPLGSFQNACGCGCQQSLECPQVIECEPGDLACAELAELCPLSAVASPGG